MDVRYTGEGVGSPIGLDWGEFGNYGTDSEAGRYLGNHDGTCDYEGKNNKTDTDAFKVFADDNITRKRQGRELRPI